MRGWGFFWGFGRLWVRRAHECFPFVGDVWICFGGVCAVALVRWCLEAGAGRESWDENLNGVETEP